MFSLAGRYNKCYRVIPGTSILTNISQVIIQYAIKKQFGYSSNINEAGREQLSERNRDFPDSLKAIIYQWKQVSLSLLDLIKSDQNKNRNSNGIDTSQNANTIPPLEMVNIYKLVIKNTDKNNSKT